MLDIGWGELFLIGIVALIVVGPKDLPALFRTVGNFTGKARAMAREFQRSLEQAANESGMSEVSQSLRSIDRTIDSATGSARKFASSMTRLPEAAKPETPPGPAAPPAAEPRLAEAEAAAPEAAPAEAQEEAAATAAGGDRGTAA
jgi:sec-independent protein translocase protein TatB